MKNLYQRLRPQAITAIDNMSKSYPYTVRALVEDLENNYAIRQMKYESAIVLSETLVNSNTVDFRALADHFEMPEL